MNITRWQEGFRSGRRYSVNYSYFKVFDRRTDIHEITPCRPACADRECSFSRRDFYERLLPSGL